MCLRTTYAGEINNEAFVKYQNETFCLHVIPPDQKKKIKLHIINCKASMEAAWNTHMGKRKIIVGVGNRDSDVFLNDARSSKNNI